MPWNAGFSPCLAVLLDRFNSATAAMPWKTVDVRLELTQLDRLQFGHGGDAVEDDGPVPLGVEGAFELQFGHGGDAVEDLGPSLAVTMVGRASILPRRRCRGRPCDPRSPKNPQSGLQFGHGGDAVEDLIQTPTLPQFPEGFNSATAAMPWKTAKAPSVPQDR